MVVIKETHALARRAKRKAGERVCLVSITQTPLYHHCENHAKEVKTFEKRYTTQKILTYNQ
ncbi:hypothetical protein [Clostridium sp. KNHs216]|uniref:hypothetical protein n=1 Tax=Clostridium sp. KNHs216 TaxID=1550235 RepID=UPI00116D4FED|nr:hypothetical protein [Clostridium sp. KNHs216]TQI69030.1 hypothetical protein LY85_3779 [Clostridium sp. KNHs216]